MMKIFCLVGLLTAVSLVAGTALPGEPAKGACSVKTTENAVYCPKEGRDIFAGNVKDGKCANDGTEVAKIEICVQKHYVCACSKGGCCTDDKPRPGNCKCAKPLQEEKDTALVIYVCEGCGAKSPVKDLVKHDEEKDKKAGKNALKRSCEKSGKAPHDR